MRDDPHLKRLKNVIRAGWPMRNDYIQIRITVRATIRAAREHQRMRRRGEK